MGEKKTLHVVCCWAAQCSASHPAVRQTNFCHSVFVGMDSEIPLGALRKSKNFFVRVLHNRARLAIARSSPQKYLSNHILCVLPQRRADSHKRMRGKTIPICRTPVRSCAQMRTRLGLLLESQERSPMRYADLKVFVKVNVFFVIRQNAPIPFSVASKLRRNHNRIA